MSKEMRKYIDTFKQRLTESENFEPPFEMDEGEVDVRWPNGRSFEFTHQLRKVN